MKKYKTFKQLKRKWLKKPAFKKAYDDLELEFKLVEAIIEQRVKNGITQKELAQRIGTKQSAIARFESGKSNPTLSFIQKLSDGLGLKLKIHV